jgi:peptide/nickel transport system permease protein
LKRLIQMIPVILIMSMVIFAIAVLLPGDPTVTILGEEAAPDQRERVREEYGLNDPIPVRYARWLSRVLQGDLGRSFRTREPVLSMLEARIPVTIELTFLSMLVSVLIGVSAGMAAAKWHHTWVDIVASIISMVGVAIPFFWLGILLILLFSLRLGWLPPSGYVPLTEDVLENLRLMLMPTLTVGLAMSAIVMRQTRASMLEVLSADYIRTARGKGLREWTVVYRHALRNALIPIVTVVGLQTGALLGGAIVTETVFSLPGLGRMLVNGIFRRDFPVVQGAILFIVLSVLLVNLVTDLIYAFLDPQIHYD